MNIGVVTFEMKCASPIHARWTGPSRAGTAITLQATLAGASEDTGKEREELGEP